MSAVRLLFDENVPELVELAFRRRLPAVELLVVGKPEAPAKGTQDPQLLSWCASAGCVLLTLDRRTMSAHFAAFLAAGHRSAGVILAQGRANLNEVIEDLAIIVGASSAEEWIDRLEYLPL